MPPKKEAPVPELFKHLSVMQMALLFCLGSLAVTWLGVFLFDRLAHGWIHGRRNANEMIGLTLASFSTLYGILLGLLAVEAYQDFSAVQDIVSKEALTIATLHRDFDGFPQPTRERASGQSAQLCARGDRRCPSAAQCSVRTPIHVRLD